jgi:hypothetical protein
VGIAAKLGDQAPLSAGFGGSKPPPAFSVGRPMWIRRAGKRAESTVEIGGYFEYS